jgi:hypothetical protein
VEWRLAALGCLLDDLSESGENVLGGAEAPMTVRQQLLNVLEIYLRLVPP